MLKKQQIQFAQTRGQQMRTMAQVAFRWLGTEILIGTQITQEENVDLKKKA